MRKRLGRRVCACACVYVCAICVPYVCAMRVCVCQCVRACAWRTHARARVCVRMRVRACVHTHARAAAKTPKLGAPRRFTITYCQITKLDLPASRVTSCWGRPCDGVFSTRRQGRTDRQILRPFRNLRLTAWKRFTAAGGTTRRRRGGASPKSQDFYLPSIFRRRGSQ